MLGRSDPGSCSSKGAKPNRAKRRQARQKAQGFNFTHHMAALCADIATRLPDIAHVDMEQVALSFSQTRKPVPHGMLASLTPMRFENGALIGTRKGRRYTAQRLYGENGHEILYILTFFLPRFMDYDFHEKMTTIFHELWHISPHFDGDLRRHPGRCYIHSGSQKDYDAHAADLAKQWLALAPPKALYDFLYHDFHSLAAKHSGVYGNRIPHPKLIPIS